MEWIDGNDGNENSTDIGTKNLITYCENKNLKQQLTSQLTLSAGSVKHIMFGTQS